MCNLEQIFILCKQNVIVLFFLMSIVTNKCLHNDRANKKLSFQTQNTLKKADCLYILFTLAQTDSPAIQSVYKAVYRLPHQFSLSISRRKPFILNPACHLNFKHGTTGGDIQKTVSSNTDLNHGFQTHRFKCLYSASTCRSFADLKDLDHTFYQATAEMQLPTVSNA